MTICRAERIEIDGIVFVNYFTIGEKTLSALIKITDNIFYTRESSRQKVNPLSNPPHLAKQNFKEEKCF